MVPHDHLSNPKSYHSPKKGVHSHGRGRTWYQASSSISIRGLFQWSCSIPVVGNCSCMALSSWTRTWHPFKVRSMSLYRGSRSLASGHVRSKVTIKWPRGTSIAAALKAMDSRNWPITIWESGCRETPRPGFIGTWSGAKVSGIWGSVHTASATTPYEAINSSKRHSFTHPEPQMTSTAHETSWNSARSCRDRWLFRKASIRSWTRISRGLRAWRRAKSSRSMRGNGKYEKRFGAKVLDVRATQWLQIQGRPNGHRSAQLTNWSGGKWGGISIGSPLKYHLSRKVHTYSEWLNSTSFFLNDSRMCLATAAFPLELHHANSCCFAFVGMFET